MANAPALGGRTVRWFGNSNFNAEVRMSEPADNPLSESGPLCYFFELNKFMK